MRSGPTFPRMAGVGALLPSLVTARLALAAALTLPTVALFVPAAALADPSDEDEEAVGGDVLDAQPVDPAAAKDLKLPAGTRWLPDIADEEDVPNEKSTFTPRAQRRTTYLAAYTAKTGDTVRKVAYRYCTSPAFVAAANRLPLEHGRDTPLRPGQQIQVPVAFGAPSGFGEGEQLTQGPGIAPTRKDNTNWGRPHVVQSLRQVFRELHKRWPNRHPALVGSLSRPGGGKLGRHKSHRSGQDVDIGYFTYAANRAQWGRPAVSEIDYQRTWFMIDWLEKTGNVAAIYMAPAIQRKLYAWAKDHGEDESRLQHMFQYGPKGSRGDTLIRNTPGHRDHFHLRMLFVEDFQDVRKTGT